MKKPLALALTLLLLTGLFVPIAPTPATTAPFYGDIDRDGVIDAADVTLLRRYIASGNCPDFAEANEIIELYADVNADGTIDAADVSLLRQHLVATDRSTVPLGPLMVEEHELNLISSVGTFYDVPIAVSNLTDTSPKRFQMTYNPRTFELAALPNGAFLHDSARGIIRFEYAGDTSGGFDGIVGTVRFRAVGFERDAVISVGVY